MITKLARVTVIVRDQDEALRFYTEKLGLEIRADFTIGPGMRWLTVAPAGQSEVEIVLQQPSGWHDEQERQQMLDRVGQGTTWVFYTDDCHGDYEALAGRGVEFVSAPANQVYGVEAVFHDLYGNTFSLLQPRQ